MVELFPFSEYWWFYIGFVGLVLLLLALDLGVFHRKAHTVSFREAAIWTAVWITLALLFNLLLYQYALWKFPHDTRLMAVPGFDPQAAAWRVSLEYLTGYLIEKALSVDNIFVFVMVFRYFAIPAKYQHRVLFYGILGALVFRAIFVALGAALMKYHWVVLAFGVFLIFTGFKIFFAKQNAVDPEKNLLLRLLRRVLPVTHELRGPDFFTRVHDRLYATPLLVGLVFLEGTDIVFAVDSVPAIFAITSEPLIVFTSNIFAVLGLRALYFMLAGAVDKFHLLQYGLGVVLIFVGLKMVWLNDLYGGKFPITVSLGVIALVLAMSVALSLLFPRREAEKSKDSLLFPASGDPSDGKGIKDRSTPHETRFSLVTKKIRTFTGPNNHGSGKLNARTPLNHASRTATLSMHPSTSAEFGLSRGTIRFLRRVLAGYLVLMGLALLLAAVV
jgi:tellurite resistance protein TerC